ncbi:1-aminocyclopropane-1-carboxylate deaminase/D-cysteine desulfhydrase [Anabaena cylindrica FACHB-243]|uniref:1-aminocyclopropane-1-carboxylate deaminase n=1 Tax=Anabaena cylindrica (strain ATCC 27899 / PCC 7122) TaxID=272123 RepID=K9ZJA6_ANACC|nr:MULTISPECIES: pyridoxal-phosphate dependent enzyme [Anabaena]AFZ58425.1 1-aminocyclopropane-1-carboxylate deaminase [Anabaena cylindrica PCC 7122]MBD2417020.1 1-aminocyclopropane-1-carboxylate deaminase/D-cysteine desulfhydrase [Anabaena cylindrica FACHB-243]MBY5280656.1 1-aminocyclopropane-1-carboxylate deaminase/D-cysteine desulfhydrase [Anabaena sp. CCAP 1446/1C]MBY5311645.1 1-aminocyclopropane-1-carboxylate deaminase/D-cysteine desulfhydrase [Anabaena sp. CCAP 1446/1C]MCM2406557.1 pyrid
MSSIFLSPPIQQINSQIADNAGVELYVLRLDMMHPQVNGNKWFKLKYNLLEAKAKNLSTLLTFGGAYSNHIFATAAAGNLFGFRTIGVIRGEETLPLNPTLSFAVEKGMHLVYVNRQTYRQRDTNQLQEELKQRFGEVFIIPEGGCNLNGVHGCREILKTTTGFDTICLACGTATTLAGIVLSSNLEQRVIGFPVLKGGDFLTREIHSLLQNYLVSDLSIPVDFTASWELVCDYHFGGYAKVNEELIRFCQSFNKEHGILLDYVYTGKMFYGVIDLLQQGYFQPGRILLIHTGGLQGNMGIKIIRNS